MPGAKPLNPVRIPPALVGVGVLMILLGFGLPLLVSGPVAAPAPSAATPAAEKAAGAFNPHAAPADQQAPGNAGLALLRLVVALAAVCGGCVLVARWFGNKPREAVDASMTVVASLRVERCAVHLVRAGDRRILIGTDATGVKALVELPGPGPEPVPEAPSDVAPAAAPR